MVARKATVMVAGVLQDMPTGDTLVGAATSIDTFGMTNAEATAIIIGAPVYIFATGSVKKAQANAMGTSRIMGLVYDVTISNGAIGNICTDGPVTATTTQWDAVTGQTGGLTPGSAYYLDAATVGKITATPPSAAGQTVVNLGIALSTTVFDVTVTPPYLMA